MAEAVRHHGNRHGRSEEARQAVLNAADDLLAEKGFAGVTVEGIAARAGVAKQTIYRWWKTKTAVLLDALLGDAAEDLPAPHGDLGRDLRAYLTWLGAFLADSDPGSVFRALLAYAQHNPEFAAEFRTRYLDEQRRRDRMPLERAAERGDLPAGFDIAAETDRLVGPLYFRALVTGDPIDAGFVDGIVDAFVRRIG